MATSTKRHKAVAEKTPAVPTREERTRMLVESLDGILKTSDEERITSLEGLKGLINALKYSIQYARLESQTALSHHKNSSREELSKHKAGVDQVVSELEEAFKEIWPKFDSLEKMLPRLNSMDKSLEMSESSIETLFSDAEKQAKEIIFNSGQIVGLSKLIEKRYQSALKKINIYDGERGAELRKEIERIDKLLKEIGKYEYGSSLNILSAGNPLGFTGILNFKSGFTVALNGAQVDVSATPTAFSIIAVTGTIDDSNTSFTAASQPTLLNINGAFYQKTGGAITWTYVAGSITLSVAVGSGGSIFGV